MMDTAFAWLLTYWLHSTIALTAMWVASRFLRDRNLALEEAGWKVALFATLLTATMQVGLTRTGQFRPLAGVLEVQVAAPREVAVSGFDAAPEVVPPVEVTLPSTPIELGDSASRESRAEPFGRTSRGAIGAGFAFWLLTTTVLLIRLVVSYLTLMGRLKGRRELRRGTHFALLERLRSRAGVIRDVGLSVCAALSVPLALGLRRWEVCLPNRVAEEFDADEQETVLAHELAHLVRYDTLWLLVARTLAGVLFFQPLNFLATARLHVLSELRCDDWAVERTGRPVTLAKCLTRVASWRSDRWGSFPVPAMAGSAPSQFGARVRRLLARSYPQPQGRVPRWLRLSAVPLVIVFAAAAPGAVQRTGAPQPTVPSVAPEVSLDRGESPESPDVPEAPAVSPGEIAGSPSAPPVPPNLPPVAPTVELTPLDPPAPKPPIAPPTVADTVAPAVPQPPALAPPAERAPGSAEAATGTLAPRATPAAPFRTIPLAHSRFARLNASGSFVGSDSAPESPSGSDDQQVAGQAHTERDVETHEDDEYHDVYDDELDAFEDQMDELEDALEQELEALEDELDDQLDEIEDAAEEHLEEVFEEFEDKFDDDVELAEAQIESLEQRLEAELLDGTLSEAQAQALEVEVERRERHLQRFEEETDRELERLVRQFERTAERLWGRDFERQIERAMEGQGRTIERRMESAARELESAARRLETVHSEEERAALVAEIRAKAREMMPSETELAEIRQSAERLRAELVPRGEEFERVQAEFRRALEQWRAEYSQVLEQLSLTPDTTNPD